MLKKSLLSLVLIFTYVFTLHPDSSFAGPDTDNNTEAVEIDQWLTAGPFKVHLPLYHDVENITGGTFSASDLLHTTHIPKKNLRPAEGERLNFRGNVSATWSRHQVSQLQFSQADQEDSFHAWYAATYVRTDRWTHNRIKIEGPHAFALYVNGERVASKTTFQDEDEDPGNLQHELNLPRGHHRILVKVLAAHDGPQPAVSATWEQLTDGEPAATFSTQKRGPASLSHMVDRPVPASVSVSPDGRHVALVMREARPDENSWESWIELRNAEDGSLKTTWRGGMQFSGLTWAPTGNKFSYTTSESGKSTLWVVDLSEGTQVPVLRDVEHMGGHEWSPDGSFILFSKSERYTPDGSGVSRLDGMHDRYPTWRIRSFIHRVNYPELTTERITAGILTTSLNSISPDGKKLVYSRTHIDYSERPFSRVEMRLLDLEKMQSEQLFEAPWVGGASFSPDGKTLLLTGSPNAFGDLGRNIEGDLANDYDMQAYLYDLENRRPTAFTRDFDPTVGDAQWSHDGRYIYLSTTDRSFSNVYRYDTRSERFTKLETGVDMASGFSVSARAQRAAYIGHGINDYHKAYLYDLRRDRRSLLADPAADFFRDVYFGTSKDWKYETDDGTEIDGHVYYPVDFDPDKSWPVIVYYYGGTAPVTRAFGGRYPKELYAAHGYIVYVMQPSGSTGFGQEYATRHLNDWGILVSGEIIQGVEQFLEAHPYADPERVGAMGASFGGFMTMLLLTETDIFSAAVSHAGISNITSYWGDGFWGYLYSSVASANSFPWDSPEIYVEQSPIFRADKVNTPLLLLHGMSDTNVPPAESTQFYTALKLLGKDVEYIQIDNQDHHIVDYNKFILWKSAIMSWFDRHLKGESEWWDEAFE